MQFESFYIIATFQDPYHKGALNEEMTKKAKECLKEMIKQERKRTPEPSVVPDNEVKDVVDEFEEVGRKEEIE